MIKLVEITEENWLAVRRMTLGEEQKTYLDSPVGILARGYVYRDCRPRVYGIDRDGKLVGVAFVKDLDEEPACYDLQQLMIDLPEQGKGYGTEV